MQENQNKQQHRKEFGNILSTPPTWTIRDYLGALKVRLGLGRMNYMVLPGLYALNAPQDTSPVFVTANYKLSFDHLKYYLSHMDAWILVLNTEGINVWCAAGKGTFGTTELIEKINSTSLASQVSHKKIIVPQLGAPGISAHEVQKNTGFRVVYGPIRAKDIPAFLDNKLRATPDMRKVTFSLGERLKLIPVECVTGLPYLLKSVAILLIIAILSAFFRKMFGASAAGYELIVLIVIAYFLGTIAAPILLPILPFNSFALKGFILGLISAPLVSTLIFPHLNTLSYFAANLMMIPLISFLTLNFTGATTFTSLSGVKKEIRIAVPLQILTIAVGFILWLISLFVT